MSEPLANSPGAPQLGQPTPLPPAELAAVFRRLLAEVTALHEAGRLHGGILAGVGDTARPALGMPASRISLVGSANALDTTPPELAGRPAWDLPVELAAAAAQLAAAGVEIDPRRIDIYQLGVLLCRLASGQPIGDYLRSPKARGLVPSGLRSVIDAALGHSAPRRLVDCRAFSAVLAVAANPPAYLHTDDTPSAGVQLTPIAVPPTSYDGAKHENSPLPADALLPSFDAPPAEPQADEPTRDLTEARSASLVGTRLGVYRILERIGGGGMGDVYRAIDDSLDRTVAIKVLPAGLAQHADFVRRFKAEAVAIARLTHPNIVQVYACGEDAGRHFFAMQFVQGESLAELLKRRGRLPVAEALPLFEQCLAGLAAAHQRGLIHRDIKPGNILLDRELGQALVADFGLVKYVDSGESLTVSGVIMGTVDYIAPEQARSLRVDARSDLYSLGALMYQTLAGRLPFAADSPTTMIFQHAYEQPAPLTEVAADVPPALAAIVLRLMAKDPAQRYQSAKDVLQDLAAFRAGELPSGVAPASATAAGPTVASTAQEPPHQFTGLHPRQLRRWVPAAVAALLAAALALAAIRLFSGTQPAAPAPPAANVTPENSELAVEPVASPDPALITNRAADLPPRIETSAPPAISSHRHGATSAPTDATPPQDPASERPAPDAAWIPLLPLVEIARDTTDAQWKVTSDRATLRAGNPRASVAFPLAIRGSYELAGYFTLSRSLKIQLPITEQKSVALEISGDNGYQQSPTATVRLQGTNPEPEAAASRSIQTGQEYALACRVTVTGPTVQIDVRRDGQALFHWSGDIGQIAGRPAFRPGSIGLETAYFATATIRDLKLKMTRGTAQPVESSSGMSKRADSPPAARLPGLVCGYIAAGKGISMKAAGGEGITGAAGDGRIGAKGILMSAPAGWQQTGTTWTFDYQRLGMPYGLQIIHPFGQGHMLVSLWREAAIVSGGAWDAFGWHDPPTSVPLDKAPELAAMLPIETNGDASVRIVSQLDGTGQYRLSLDGRTVLQARIEQATPLTFGSREFPHTEHDDRLLGPRGERRLAVGEAGLLLGPVKNEMNRAMQVRLEAKSEPAR